VPRAIEAHSTFDLEHMAALADEAEERLAQLGLTPLPGEKAPFMRALGLRTDEPELLRGRLFEEHRVEVPVYEWEDRSLLRVSVGSYTNECDLDRLVTALRGLI
jgi:selenocysteine lyase/cysteine desulfurase